MKKSIVDLARKHIGTPWQHEARLPGVALDCVGLLFCVFKDYGIDIQEKDIPAYSLHDEFEKLNLIVRSFCRQIKKATIDLDNEEYDYNKHSIKWRAGDIIVFRARLMTNHAAIYSGEGTMIHSYSSPGFMRVVEQKIDSSWYTRINSVFRIK